MLNKNQNVTLEITEINNLGCGVGRVDGMVVFVKGAVSGDTVEAKIIKVNKSFAVGKLESIVSPSEHRMKEEFCNAPNACGGCVYRHVTYPHELEMKKKYVENAFRKVGLPEVRVDEVMSTGDMSGYRNKAQYPFGKVGGKTCVGFYASKTHKVIPCNVCTLQPQVFSDICDFVCAFADENKWSVYDEERGAGLLRHLYIRMGKNTGEIMVCVVINGDYLTKEQEFAAALCERFEGVKSVLVNINKKNTNVVLGNKYRTVKGRDYIEDVLLGKRFRISAGSFYQVNHDGAELLYSIAKQKAEEMGAVQTLLDLYCGLGTIGISIGDGARRTVGIEIVDEAIACAKENAEINGVKHAQFYCGDAGNAEKLLDNAEREGGIIANATVIVDPPRKGLDEELIHYLSKREMDRIVYVSCDPDTLARDCVIFKGLGYTIGRVTPVDMFPRTGHVESVVSLMRSN
jgi:23S rRNA (uracil1939-C5)-methyltransferase